MELETLAKYTKGSSSKSGFVPRLKRIFLGSVRVRTSVAATAVVGIALAVSSMVLVGVLSNQLKANLIANAKNEATSTVDLIRSGELANPIPLPSGDLAAQVLDGSGRVLASTSNVTGKGPFVGIAFIKSKLTQEIVSISNWTIQPAGDTDSRALLIVHKVQGGSKANINIDSTYTSLVNAQSSAGLSKVTPVPLENGHTPNLYVAVIASLASVDQPIRFLIPALTIGGLMLLVIVGFATFYLTGRAFRPVDQMISDAKDITGTSLHRRVFEPEGDDEISRLAITMNRMLERLEESAESSRRFVADASHELKSPISALQTSLEVSLLRPQEADWPRVALDGLTEAHRMQTLVEDLLILAKADAGRLKLKFESVDLDELVIEEARRARSRTTSKIRLSSVSGGRVIGEAEKLRSVVRNLMENAIRHCESTVSIALKQEGSSVVFEVLDDGPGVPEADRETIFRRFVRLDESRSRGDGGSGLGLAITKSIVEAHLGRIWVEDNNLTGKGARFVVVLPAADPSFTSQPLEITP